MQVFKTFFKIAKKHMVQVIIYTVVFLILIMLMSFSAKKTQTEQFSSKSIDITIIDHDNSELSEGIRTFLDARHNIVELEKTDAESLTDNLFYQRISYVLTIPAGFEENFLHEKNLSLSHTMRQDSASGFFVNHQLDSFLNAVNLYLVGGASLSDAITKTLTHMGNSPAVESVVFEQTGKSTNNTMFYYFQYLGYIFLMIFAVSIVPILTTFQDADLHARISCSSTSSKKRSLQIGLGCVCYSLCAWILFMLLALILFKPENLFSEQGKLCLLNSFIYTLICTAITLLLSSFHLKDNSLNLVSNIVGLGMSFLCGVFVPQWFLAEKVLLFGRFFPAYWYIRTINMINGWSGETYSMENYWKYLGVELFFLVAIFSVYMVISKQRKHASE